MIDYRLIVFFDGHLPWNNLFLYDMLSTMKLSRSWRWLVVLVLAVTYGCAVHASDMDNTDSKKFLLGAQLGFPIGGAVYGMYAPVDNLSIGPYIAHISVIHFDLWRFGARIRWHWAHHAPRGGYLFADLSYLHGTFGDVPAGETVLSEDNNAFQPLFGAGYQFYTNSPITLDLGAGFGPKVTFQRTTTNTAETSETSGELYLGLACLF